MKTHMEWLEELIQELNYDTLIEEPWTISFLDANHKFQTMGTSRKNAFYVSILDRTIAEFPIIREQLKSAKKILQVLRVGRNGGQYPLPEEFKGVFRIDFIHENQQRMVVLLDREDVVCKKMRFQDALEFINTYKLPVPLFDHELTTEKTQYIFIDEILLPIHLN